MSAGYVEKLSDELAAVGIRGRLARRISAEISDHLALDPEADLGSPMALARQFADELGTERARRAAGYGFAALAVGGLILGVAVVASSAAGISWARVDARSPLLAWAAGVVVALGAQVALVAGVFAAMRALRFRDELAIPRAEARVIDRRTSIAVGAGLATMAGMAVLAIEFRHGVPGWMLSFLPIGAALGAAALLAAAPAVLAAARVQPVAAGSSGDLFEDLGPVVPKPLRKRPWRLAICVAAGLVIASGAAGALQSDAYDGIARGLLDALACLAGFAILGRYLGLRT